MPVHIQFVNRWLMEARPSWPENMKLNIKIPISMNVISAIVCVLIYWTGSRYTLHQGRFTGWEIKAMITCI